MASSLSAASARPWARGFRGETRGVAAERGRRCGAPWRPPPAGAEKAPEKESSEKETKKTEEAKRRRADICAAGLQSSVLVTDIDGDVMGTH